MEDAKQVENIKKLLKNSTNLDRLDNLFKKNIEKNWLLIKEELKKNKYTDFQYFAIANLLFSLNNIDKINSSKIKYDDLPQRLYNNFSKIYHSDYDLLNERISLIIKQIMESNNNNENKLNKKRDIIMRFIDEFLYLKPIKSVYLVNNSKFKGNKISKNNREYNNSKFKGNKISKNNREYNNLYD